jgi:MinD-like ATPase involved in chromosome partitioning or flagellar assembly
MAKIISLHSFRGGTGKSNTTANLAGIFASQGKRVGVIDTDILSPGIYVLFGFNQAKIKYSLNDYLWGQCRLEQAAYDVTAGLGASVSGKVFLIPSSIKPGEITRILREGYDTDMLNEGLLHLIDTLKLDILLIDTHPGLNEETLFSIAFSDTILLLLRPDQQDYQGTSVTLQVARKLGVPELLLVVNKFPKKYKAEDIRAHIQKNFSCEVAAAFPHSDELMILASERIFALKYPEHPVTAEYKRLAARVAP